MYYIQIFTDSFMLQKAGPGRGKKAEKVEKNKDVDSDEKPYGCDRKWIFFLPIT